MLERIQHIQCDWTSERIFRCGFVRIESRHSRPAKKKKKKDYEECALVAGDGYEMRSPEPGNGVCVCRSVGRPDWRAGGRGKE